MKKLLLVFTLSVLTFSCSSDSDGVSINQDLVGSWSGYIADIDCSVDLILDEDATGSVNFYGGSDCGGLSGITWSSSSATLTINTLIESVDENGIYVVDEDGNYVYEIDEVDVFNYELDSADGVLNLTNDDGVFTLYAD
tara:strand:- start:91 stop:507 length:417 start_codon:yes stop_codon:yes gene_type:complete